MFLLLILINIQSQSIDLTTIVSKPKQEIESVLGKVERIEKYKPIGQKCECERFQYMDGQIRIIYKEGKADRIYLSYKIKIVNLDKVKINSFQRWRDNAEVRVSGEESCCFAS